VTRHEATATVLNVIAMKADVRSERLSEATGIILALSSMVS
jgi:hypothetical protein